jgi:hypothetical protein
MDLEAIKALPVSDAARRMHIYVVGSSALLPDGLAVMGWGFRYLSKYNMGKAS